MKTILIPTNFEKQSLQLIKSAVLLHPDTKLTIVLVAGYKIRLNAYDLQHYSSEKIIKKAVSDSFLEKIKNLKEEHNSILSIEFDLFLESSIFSFDNFLKVKKIDEVIMPKNILEEDLKNQFFSIIPQIKNSNIKSREIRLKSNSKFQNNGFFSFFRSKNK